MRISWRVLSSGLHLERETTAEAEGEVGTEEGMAEDAGEATAEYDTVEV